MTTVSDCGIAELIFLEFEPAERRPEVGAIVNSCNPSSAFPQSDTNTRKVVR